MGLVSISLAVLAGEKSEDATTADDSEYQSYHYHHHFPALLTRQCLLGTEAIRLVLYHSKINRSF